jgi:cyclase
MLKSRVIPTLLLNKESLVKTKQFRNFNYVGDPCNTVKIFNELEVDELLFLDISSKRISDGPNFSVLQEIADECFMPLSYGGGISNFEHAKKIFNIGFEKVVLNSALFENEKLITEISETYGNQAIIASVDYKKDFYGNVKVFSNGGRLNTKKDVISWVKSCEALGAGEILLTSIEREGTWDGLDFDMIKAVTESVNIPVIAHGGAGTIDDIRIAIKECKCSAVGLGSMVVYQKKDMGVLVNFPIASKLEDIIYES